MGILLLDVPEQAVGDVLQSVCNRGRTRRRDLSEELVHLGFGLTNVDKPSSIWG